MEKDNKKLIEEIGLLKKRIAEYEKVRYQFKEAEKVAKEAREYVKAIADTVRDPLVVLDSNLIVESANEAFYETFKVKPNETVGQLIYDVGNRQWNIPKLRKLLEDILPSNSVFNNYVVEHDFLSIGKRTMVLNARCIPSSPTRPQAILLAIEDITDIDRIKLIFEKMAEEAVFSKLAHKNDTAIIELKNEVNALLTRLNEKLKYAKSDK